MRASGLRRDSREPSPGDGAASATFVVLACMSAGLIALVVMVGWIADLPVLRSLLPGAVEMKANTSIGLMACASALWLASLPPSPSNARLSRVIASFAALIGFATSARWCSAGTWASTSWSCATPAPHSTRSRGGCRLTAPSCSRCSACAVARPVAASAPPRDWCVGWPGSVPAIGVVSLVGYLWNATEIITDQIAPPVAINTALAFIALGMAIFLLARPPGLGCSLASRAGARDARPRRLRSEVLFMLVGGGLTYESGANFAEAAAASRTPRRCAPRSVGSTARSPMRSGAAQPRADRLDPYVKEFLAAAPAWRASREGARRSGRDNLEQTRLQRDMSRLARRKIGELRRWVGCCASRATEGRRGAFAGRARPVDAEMRDLSRRMDEAEATLLNARLHRSDQQRRRRWGAPADAGDAHRLFRSSFATSSARFVRATRPRPSFSG